MKKLWTLSTIAVFLMTLSVSSLLNVLATGTGGDDVDGSFESVGYNNPVELQGFELLDQNMNAAYALNPYQDYTVRLTLHDEDSIADIKQISMVFYYGTELTNDLEGLINTGTTTDGTAFVVNWERDVIEEDPFDASTPVEFSISSSAATSEFSWDIINSTTPSILADFNEELNTKTFTFELSFRVSKVAPQTSLGEWRFGLVVTDGLFPNESNLYQVTSSALNVVSSGNPLIGSGTQFNMNWFGEVEIENEMKINWSDVVPPLEFGGDNSLATTSAIIFRSNGTYERATAASDTWDIVDGSGNASTAADGSTMAALSADALTQAQTFGMIAAISGDAIYTLSPLGLLQPSNNGMIQFTILGSQNRTLEAGNPYHFEYYLGLSPFFQNAIYKGSIKIKINNSFSVASIENNNFITLEAAVAAANDGDVIKLLSNTEENISLTTAASIDFNGFTLKGNLSVEFEGERTITFSGFGTLDGNLTVNAPNLTLDTNLAVLGDTTINAVASSSFNTSGIHQGGIRIEGPGRINALNENARPVITINTTAAIVIDGFVDEVSLQVEDVVLTINAEINRLETNNKISTSLILGASAMASAQNIVRNISTNAIFNSIQAALDAAVAGNTIEVGPGIYEEDITLSTRGINLVGANNHASHIVGNSSGKPVTINAEDVTFRGFKVSNESAFYIQNTPASNTKYASAIFIDSNAGGVTIIEDNLITDVGTDNSEIQSVWAIYAGSINTGGSITIRNNTITNIHSTFVVSPGDRNLNTRAITFDGNSQADIYILGNEISNISHRGHAKAIDVNTFSIIQDNLISEIFTTSSHGGVTNVVHLRNGSSGSEFTGNTISKLENHDRMNFAQPVHVDVDINGSEAVVTISGNAFIANNIEPATIGATSGFLLARQIELFLTVFPDNENNDGSFGIDPSAFISNNTFQFEESNINPVVDLSILAGGDRGDKPIGFVRPQGLAFNVNQALGFMTIQSAIDAADEGDTIEVAAGTYVEDLEINKSMTLSGINAGISYDETRNAEAIISGGSIQFTANNITFDGFKILNSFVDRFSSIASGLTLSNTIIEHEFILEDFINMSGTGNRYMIKGFGGVTNVAIENVQLIGPGQNAVVSDSALSDRIGGIDFNNVVDSMIKNVSISDVSRYGINIGGDSKNVVVDGYQADRVGINNSFMAALYFANVTENAVTLKGDHIFDSVNIGVSLTGTMDSDDNKLFTTTENNVTLSGFTLLITKTTIPALGTVSGSSLTQASSVLDTSHTDDLARAMGFDFAYVVSDAAIEPFFPLAFYSLDGTEEVISVLLELPPGSPEFVEFKKVELAPSS